jgi:hypothetical protein
MPPLPMLALFEARIQSGTPNPFHGTSLLYPLCQVTFSMIIQMMNTERRKCMKRKPIAQHVAVFWLVSPGREKAVQWHQATNQGRRNQKDTSAWLPQEEGRGKKNISLLNICDSHMIVV